MCRGGQPRPDMSNWVPLLHNGILKFFLFLAGSDCPSIHEGIHEELAQIALVKILVLLMKMECAVTFMFLKTLNFVGIVYKVVALGDMARARPMICPVRDISSFAMEYTCYVLMIRICTVWNITEC